MLDSIKQRLRSNTNRAAILLSVILVPLEVNFHLLQEALGANYGYAYIGFSILMVAMRDITTKPITER